MTLQPYDGATYVLLPDGRECWEKETKHFMGSETQLSYQYSVEIDNLSTDYWGRVTDLKALTPDGSWNEIVTFFPISPALVARIKLVMERGWNQFAEGAAQGLPEDGSSNRLYSDGYLRVMGDVLVMLRGAMQP